MKTNSTLPGCAYLLTFPNGKKYVGVTSQKFSERWRNHKKAAARGSTLLVHRAIRKYGDPSVHILVEGMSMADLLALEIKFILDFKTKAPSGYNLTDGGDGVTGWYAAATEAVQAEFREKSRLRMLALHAAGVLSAKPAVDYGRSDTGRARRSRAMSERMTVDSDFRKSAVANLRAAAGTEKHRIALLSGIEKRGADPLWQEGARLKMQRINSDPEMQIVMAKKLSERNADPDFQKRRLSRVREATSKPEWLKRNAEMNAARRKITDEQLPEMKRLLDDGVSQKKVAEHFHCSVATIVHMKELLNRRSKNERN